MPLPGLDPFGTGGMRNTHRPTRQSLANPHGPAAGGHSAPHQHSGGGGCTCAAKYRLIVQAASQPWTPVSILACNYRMGPDQFAHYILHELHRAHSQGLVLMFERIFEELPGWLELDQQEGGGGGSRGQGSRALPSAGAGGSQGGSRSQGGNRGSSQAGSQQGLTARQQQARENRRRDAQRQNAAIAAQRGMGMGPF